MANKIGQVEVKGKPQRVVIEGGGSYLNEDAIRAAVSEVQSKMGLTELTDIVLRGTADMHPDIAAQVMLIAARTEMTRRGWVSEELLQDADTASKQLAARIRQQEVLRWAINNGIILRRGRK